MTRSSLLVAGPMLALALALNATAAGSDARTDGGAELEAAAANAAVDGIAAAAVASEVAATAQGSSETAAEPTAETAVAALGPIGYDEQGRPGRVHVVRSGDTLWDLSEDYLGTPWVWPSIWKDNPEVANPHLIYPGDRIWITPTEMRRLSVEEAERMLAARPPAEEPPPAALEDTAVEPAAGTPPAVYVMSAIESVGLISQQELEAAASIVESTESRTWLHQDDPVNVGLGEGEVSAGDRFTVVRPSKRITDPDTGEDLGVFVDVLGWLEVTELHPESSIATIRSSHSEIRRGDRLLPRQEMRAEVVVRPTSAPVDGKIAFLPHDRTAMGTADLVYLNRGIEHGLYVGNPLDVYEAGEVADETVRQISVQLPDHVIAKLLVVSAQPRTSVAVVTFAKRDVATGDRFRSSSQLEQD